MKARIVEQIEPSHWATTSKGHAPWLCLLCWVSRLGHWLGVIAWEDDGPTFGAADGFLVQGDALSAKPFHRFHRPPEPKVQVPDE